MWRLSEAYRKGQYKYQMGDNTNLVDYCYVGNVADAHVLAADKLAQIPDSSSASSIAGEVFFISDGKPVPYHTFPRLVYRELGDTANGADAVVLPRWLCIIIAFFSELWARWVTGGLPTFPRFFVDIATREQYYSIEKVRVDLGVLFTCFHALYQAKRLLGYEPRVPLEDGVKMMVDVSMILSMYIKSLIFSLVVERARAK
jgi:sterol-4alpha-carboxylate 3-dehydrogenase (decarboxylating)